MNKYNNYDESQGKIQGPFTLDQIKECIDEDSECTLEEIAQLKVKEKITWDVSIAGSYQQIFERIE